MPETLTDIELEVAISANGGVPLGLLRQVTAGLEQEVMRSELRDLHLLADQIPDISEDVVRRTERGLRSHRREGVLIEKASSGSIILTLSLTGILIWVLQNTLGETFKDAWKESGLHERIKKILLSGEEKKVHNLAAGLKDALVRGYARNAYVDIRVDRSGSYRIRVRIELKRDGPPRRGKL